MMKPMISSFIKTEEGAISSLYAATSPEIETLNLWYVAPFNAQHRNMLIPL